MSSSAAVTSACEGGQHALAPKERSAASLPPAGGAPDGAEGGVASAASSVVVFRLRRGEDVRDACLEGCREGCLEGWREVAIDGAGEMEREAGLGGRTSFPKEAAVREAGRPRDSEPSTP